MSYKQKSPLPVAEGGTNTSSFPFNHGVLVFEAGQQISINPGIATHVLTSNGPASPPTFQVSSGGSGVTQLDADTGSATGATITIVGGSNLNTFASAASLTVEGVNSPSVVGSITAGAGFIATTGGIDFSNFIEGALVTSVTGVTSSVTGTAGFVLTANAAGTAPSFQAAGGGGGLSWNDTTGATQALAVNNGYSMNRGTLITATLPATAAFGSIIEISGYGAGGWIIAQNASQTIHFGAVDTTTGTMGTLASSNRYDCVKLFCAVANTDFVVQSAIGNLTYV